MTFSTDSRFLTLGTCRFSTFYSVGAKFKRTQQQMKWLKSARGSYAQGHQLPCSFRCCLSCTHMSGRKSVSSCCAHGKSAESPLKGGGRAKNQKKKIGQPRQPANDRLCYATRRHLSRPHYRGSFVIDVLPLQRWRSFASWWPCTRPRVKPRSAATCRWPMQVP